MNTTISVIQATLAIVFFASGAIILILKEKLKSKLSWLNFYAPKMVYFICLSKIAGAIGLIIPMLISNTNFLAIISAIGICTIMALAFNYHLKKREYKDMPATILFFILALAVAIYKY
ncbi:MAG: DoxX family protein [Bacteroidota bacterium]|nr:DoxX family protein [Bacteroidota bacterium]